MAVVAITDEETVARFVLRARRIEAHSLVQDREAFAERLNDTWTMHLAADGSGRFIRSLPADEEVFESLAARVRPLTLEREPIYFEKVLGALGRLLVAASAATDQQRERLNELSAAWRTVALERQVQAFAVQSANVDGSDTTGVVSDTQLAAGWMYADLVHADAQGWKEKALAFSLRERYAAATNVFPRITAVALDTLRFVEHLHHAGVVVIEGQMWEEDVVVGATEIIYEGTAYTAVANTEMPAMPDLSESLFTAKWAVDAAHRDRLFP